MKNIRLVVVGLALFLIQSTAMAGMRHEVVHVLAKDTVALAKNGVKVPKMYVLTASGALLFEGKATTDQSFSPVLSALRNRTDRNVPELPMIAKMLAARGVTFKKGGKPVLVTLEFGKSVGNCGPCDSYYPRLQDQLAAQKIDALWVHLHMEKNDYRGPAKS